MLSFRMAVFRRRAFLGSLAGATGLSVAGCLGDDDDDNGDDNGVDDGDDGDDGDPGDEDVAITLQLPEGTLHYPMYESAQEVGVFADEGIDVTVEYIPFGAQLSSITAGEVDTTMVSALPYFNDFARGEELVCFGFDGCLQSVNAMYSLTDRDYESIPDVAGDMIAPWSWGSSTVQAFEAIVADEYDLNLQEDFQTTTADPPALLGLLDDGQVDAIINTSGFTITMEAQPDTYQNLGYLNGIWEDRTGYTLPLTGWFAYEDWYDANEDVAGSLIRAGQAAVENWRANTVDILEEYGEPGGVEGEAEIQVVDDFADQGHVFREDTTDEYLDATWEALEIMDEHGSIETLPDQDEVMRDPL